MLPGALKTSSIFWNIIPFNPFKVNRRFGGTRRLHFQGRKIRHAKNQHEAATFKMEAIRSSETSVIFQWVTQRYIAEDKTLDK
jgi:hypothetical protein